MNNAEFFDAMTLLEKEKGIPEDYLMEKIALAVQNAVKRDYGLEENVLVEIDPKTQVFRVAIRKEVVKKVEDPDFEVTIGEALRYDSHPQLGDFVEIPLEPTEFGRIAAKTAKDIIRQGIREAEKDQVLKNFQSKEHEIVSAIVISVDPVRESVTLDIGGNQTILPKGEQLPGEEFTEGERIKVYVAEVLPSDRRPKIHISRTHPGFVKRLFEMEVPEVYDGTVEIKSIAREAGSRTKMAVYSKDPNVDPVGACIGAKQSRINQVVEEMGGEKIDIIKYSDNPEEYIAAALAPANVLEVKVIDEENRACRAIVEDQQLSLAIGNKGQNARLAAKLTGYKIDIRPLSDPEPPEEVVIVEVEEEI